MQFKTISAELTKILDRIATLRAPLLQQWLIKTKTRRIYIPPSLKGLCLPGETGSFKTEQGTHYERRAM